MDETKIEYLIDEASNLAEFLWHAEKVAVIADRGFRRFAEDDDVAAALMFRLLQAADAFAEIPEDLGDFFPGIDRDVLMDLKTSLLGTMRNNMHVLLAWKVADGEIPKVAGRIRELCTQIPELGFAVEGFLAGIEENEEDRKATLVGLEALAGGSPKETGR